MNQQTIYRAYTAVLRDNMILMVRHVHDGEDYWTLPGGKIEVGETEEQAAIRELMEETGIAVDSVTRLFAENGQVCFLASCSADQAAVVGSDPELLLNEQVIQDVRWFDLTEKRHDSQVSKVLSHISPNE
ncbi:MAG: NUDIX hydrolase [Chloroflexota bacterium]